MEAVREEYISKLRSFVEACYKCRATHRRTIATRPSRDPNWPARVEMFWLNGHPAAKRCFAWVDPIVPSQTYAVLELPPVFGAATAVQTALASRTDQQKRGTAENEQGVSGQNAAIAHNSASVRAVA